MFFKITKLSFENNLLSITIAQLAPLPPNGMIGTAWGITEKTHYLQLNFQNIICFKITPEIELYISENAEKCSPFLYREIDSDYLQTNRKTAEWANFYDEQADLTKHHPQHFIVYGTNYGVDVLTIQPPEIISL